MISYQDFCRLLTDTKEFATLDDYIGECGGSVNADVDTATELLSIIWALGRDDLSIYSIMQINNSTMRDLSREYKIPYRTIQNWEDGARKPPEWLLPLIAYAVLSDGQ